jgi:hypothetical protein
MLILFFKEREITVIPENFPFRKILRLSLFFSYFQFLYYRQQVHNHPYKYCTLTYL